MKEEAVKMNRVWAMPSFATFTIKPIAELLERYRVGIGWIDPFAGWNSPAEFTNDINPKAPTTHHAEAELFVQSFGLGKYYALFDPPYSNRQISEHYKEAGLSATQLDTSAQFYSKVKDKLAGVIRDGGYVISFGWNSNAMGKNRGFEIVEILLVAHGGHHNDTIVTVERKIVSLDKPLTGKDKFVIEGCKFCGCGKRSEAIGGQGSNGACICSCHSTWNR